MRSSTGQHWIALDHIRAVAAFLVFTWHFIHSSNGYPVALSGAPSLFPLAILDEGHTGVALFMTLSGYLFAKLLDGRAVDYPRFFLARVLRLVPLMAVTILLAAIERFVETGEFALFGAFATVATGFVRPFPVLDHGLWSIVVETHFYLILPCLMAVSHRHPRTLLVILGSMIVLRMLSSILFGHAQDLGYWTIVGRIDQFLLGMFAFRCGHHMRGRHKAAAMTAVAFTAFYYWCDRAGGWYGFGDTGGHGLLWAILPAIEGSAYAAIIAYYDSSFTPSDKGMSGFIGKAGAYSYSIYLLHFFVVFRMAALIDRHITSLSNFYVACLWSAMCFVSMVPIAALCFRWIEAPFLRLRRSYIRPISVERAGRPVMVDTELELAVKQSAG